MYAFAVLYPFAECLGPTCATKCMPPTSKGHMVHAPTVLSKCVCDLQVSAMGLWLQRLKRDRSASASNGSAGPRTVRSVLTPAAQPTSNVDGLTLSNSVDTSPQATDDILLDDLEIAEEKSPAGHNNTIGTGIAQTPNWNNATSSSAATRHQPDNSSACLPWGASRSLPDNSSSTSMVASNAPGCPSSTDLPAGGMPANTLSSNGFQPLSLASTNCFSHDGVCEQTDAKADVVGSRDDVATLHMLEGPSSRHSECSNPGLQPGDWFNGMPGSLVSVQSSGFPSIAAAARSNSGTSQLSSLFGSTSDVHLPYCSIRSAECQHGGSRPYSQHRSEDMSHSDSRAHRSAAHREVRSAQTWSAAGRTSAHTVHATHAGHGDGDQESPCSGGGRLLAALMPPVYQLPVVQEAATGDYEQDALSATAVHGEYSDMLPHTSMLQSPSTEPALDALPLSGIISLDAYLSALLADSGRRKMLFFTKAQLDVQACHAVAAFLIADAAASQAVRVVALPACGITDQGVQHALLSLFHTELALHQCR